MKCTLKAPLQVEQYTAFAEVAVCETRPEIGVLLKSALETRLTSTLVQQVLPGVTERGASNLIAWCHYAGLCKRNGELTALGGDAAVTNKVPVPEQGAYRFQVVSHPLIGRRIIAFQRVTPSSRDGRFEDLQPIPLEPDTEVDHYLVRGTDPIRFRGFLTNAQQPGCVREKPSTATLVWTLDFDENSSTWRVEVRPERQTATAVRAWDREALVAELAAHYLAHRGDWDRGAHRFRVPFDEVAKDRHAEESFLKDYVLEGDVQVKGAGSFQEVTLSHVPVGPRTADDARRWAHALFLRALQDPLQYRPWAEVETLFDDLVRDTPLQGYGLTLPPISHFLETIVDNRALFWSVAAPEDLAPIRATSHLARGAA